MFLICGSHLIVFFSGAISSYGNLRNRLNLLSGLTNSLVGYRILCCRSLFFSILKAFFRSFHCCYWEIHCLFLLLPPPPLPLHCFLLCVACSFWKLLESLYLKFYDMSWNGFYFLFYWIFKGPFILEAGVHQFGEVTCIIFFRLFVGCLFFQSSYLEIPH